MLKFEAENYTYFGQSINPKDIVGNLAFFNFHISSDGSINICLNASRVDEFEENFETVMSDFNIFLEDAMNKAKTAIEVVYPVDQQKEPTIIAADDFTGAPNTAFVSDPTSVNAED